MMSEYLGYVRKRLAGHGGSTDPDDTQVMEMSPVNHIQRRTWSYSGPLALIGTVRSNGDRVADLKLGTEDEIWGSKLYLEDGFKRLWVQWQLAGIIFELCRLYSLWSSQRLSPRGYKPSQWLHQRRHLKSVIECSAIQLHFEPWQLVPRYCRVT